MAIRGPGDIPAAKPRRIPVIRNSVISYIMFSYHFFKESIYRSGNFSAV
jgi:hypothetical protein